VGASIGEAIWVSSVSPRKQNDKWKLKAKLKTIPFLFDSISPMLEFNKCNSFRNCAQYVLGGIELKRNIVGSIDRILVAMELESGKTLLT
jgi:hypothetical protein